ncbi:hypothetical protein N657DRAFT_629481 [Parathielavia appendiculata]|uniref:Uncharacterized protein n=1 Tax=Parathielavia appendiculata TaxID=2587402 RepID=A0AAN6Z793_9PEZI|nr:hypothetical protein N657DRAFT_629481 [Parathielavia appendiculata]
MAPVLPTLRRALLLDNNMLPRGQVDSLIYDFKRSATTLSEARSALQEHLSERFNNFPNVGEVAVRINPVSSPQAQANINAIASLPAVDTIATRPAAQREVLYARQLGFNGKQARAVLVKAKQCGFDVDAVREDFNKESPDKESSQDQQAP